MRVELAVRLDREDHADERAGDRDDADAGDADLDRDAEQLAPAETRRGRCRNDVRAAKTAQSPSATTLSASGANQRSSGDG